MSAFLKGAPELQARFKALHKDFLKPLGKDWASEVVRLSQAAVPNRNTRWSKGRLHDSIRVKTATQKKAVVVGWYSAYFVDAGVKPHDLGQRRTTLNKAAREGRTVFARAGRKHPGYPARPFRARVNAAARRKYSVLERVIKVWNDAA